MRPTDVKNLDSAHLLRIAKTVDNLPLEEKLALFAGSVETKRLLQKAHPDVENIDRYLWALRHL